MLRGLRSATGMTARGLSQAPIRNSIGQSSVLSCRGEDVVARAEGRRKLHELIAAIGACEGCPFASSGRLFVHGLRWVVDRNIRVPNTVVSSPQARGVSPMSMDEVIDRLRTDPDALKKWVGVYIGVLAVLLAICSVGGANAAKDATRANIEATNTWAFYQAKNIRRTSTNLAADELELFVSAQPGMPAPARQAIATKVKQYRAEIERLTKDPEKGEGVEQLFQKAKAIEAERDVALRKDPYFDWSQALLQIGIVLASVHLIIGNMMLLGLSGGLAALGVLLMINGYTLAVWLPFLG